MIERRAAVSRIGIGIGIGIAIAIAIGTGTGTVAVAVAVATAAAPAGCAGTSHTTAEQRPQQWWSCRVQTIHTIELYQTHTLHSSR